MDEKNLKKSLYDFYNYQYNLLYYLLYNDIIKLFKIFEKKFDKNFIKISDVTNDLLLHPGIERISLENDTLVLNSLNYPEITQFISIKFMVFLIKYLENNVNSEE